jgi:5-methylcytosine-specific restriction endonuclease McrA
MRKRFAKVYPNVVLPVDKEEIENLIASSLGLKCPYCYRRHPTKKLTIAMLSVDHMIPVSRGEEFKIDPWTLENLQVCCKTCNAVKGPMTPGELRILEDFILTHLLFHATYIFASMAAGGGRYTRRK